MDPRRRNNYPPPNPSAPAFHYPLPTPPNPYAPPPNPYSGPPPQQGFPGPSYPSYDAGQDPRRPRPPEPSRTPIVAPQPSYPAQPNPPPVDPRIRPQDPRIRSNRSIAHPQDIYATPTPPPSYMATPTIAAPVDVKPNGNGVAGHSEVETMNGSSETTKAKNRLLFCVVCASNNVCVSTSSFGAIANQCRTGLWRLTWF